MAEITREQPDEKFLKLYMTLTEREELLAIVVALGHMSEENYQKALKNEALIGEDPLAVQRAGSNLYGSLKKEI
ncbi:hypothetical protein ES705_09356 [subsurface metagenome]